VVIKESEYSILTCAKWVKAPPEKLKSFQLGPQVANGGKSRHWLVVAGAESAEELYDTMKEAGCHSIITKFQGGTYALVFKDYDKAIDIGALTMHSPLTQGRLSKSKVLELVKVFLSGGVIGDLKLKEQGELPDWDETIAELAKLTIDELNVFLANATNHKRQKCETPLEASTLNMEKYIVPYIKKLKESHTMLFKASDGPYRFPQDFVPTIMDMEGEFWNHIDEELKTMTLREVLSSDIMYRRSLIFVGKSGRGKTRMLEAMARRICVKDSYEYYISGTSIDPLGLLTLSGKIRQAGALVLSDFDLVTLQNQQMSKENVKIFFKADEQGGIKARYHEAMMQRGWPRLLSINSDVYGPAHAMAGQIDYAHWFRSQSHCQSIIAIIEKDTTFLSTMGGNDEAIARSVIVFKVPDYLFDTEKAKVSKDDINEKFEKGRQDFLQAMGI